MKPKSKFFFSLLFFSMVLMMSTVNTQVSAKKTHPGTPPEIVYLGYEVNPDLTVTFRYQLSSGDPVLKQWELISPCFTKDNIVHVSEKYSLNPAKNRIRFFTKYYEGETRTISITLRLGYYQGVVEGDLDYDLYWEPNKSSGNVMGPVCPSNSVQFQNASGKLGTAFTGLLSLAFVAGFKKFTL